MSTQKLQVGRALAVIPSDDCNVPFPALSASGTNNDIIPYYLIDSSATFITNGVMVGDIVYSTTLGVGATVTRLVAEDELLLNADIFTGSTGESYTIYAGGNNDGCVLYVGTAGNVTIETVGGDQVSLVGVSGGQFIPIHANKVLYSGTSAGNIIALW